MILNETKESPEPFDIFKVDFIFQEDLLSQNPRSKSRPALVIRIPGQTIFPYIVAMITSKNSGQNDYEIIDFKQAGLQVKSYIRFSRQLTLDKSAMENAEYYGKLSDRDIQRIKSLGLV